MENAAAMILQRAVEMDQKEQYTMALVLYQEGLQILVDSIKGINFLFSNPFLSLPSYLIFFSFLKKYNLKKCRRFL